MSYPDFLEGKRYASYLYRTNRTAIDRRSKMLSTLFAPVLRPDGIRIYFVLSVHQILLLSYPYRMPLLIFHLMPSIVLIVTLIHVLLLAKRNIIINKGRKWREDRWNDNNQYSKKNRKKKKKKEYIWHSKKATSARLSSRIIQYLPSFCVIRTIRHGRDLM